MPKLRFRKFKDEWRKVSLKDITIRIKDKNKSLETDLPLTISAQYGLIDQREYFNKIVASKSLANYYLLKKGDFAYNKSYSTGYPYGTIKRLNKYDKGAVSTLYICFKPKNIDSNFLEQYFETDKWYKEIYKIAVEGARNHGLLNIAISDFFNTKHYIPKSKDEQIKISKFLEIVDEKIDLLEKTLCLHQKFIEGLKESIFSNLNYPKFKLNNFMKISKIKCNDNINKRLTVKLNLKGIVPRETKTTEKEGVTTQYIRKKGQFIYGKQNLYKGAFGIIPKELDGYMSSSDIPSFDFINNKLNPYWFYYFISRKNYYSRLEKYSTGTGSKRISPEEFLNIKIPLPPIEKQNNQVKMFNKLIERQNILIKEKEYLYNFKKGLLQKMFV